MGQGNPAVTGGPQPLSREDRLSLAWEIAERARAVHGGKLKAVGIYGSTAREADGPYSDLEMLCVLDTRGEEYSYEWCYGPSKAEVNFYSEDVLLRKATEVDGRWPLTHGAFLTVMPLIDPGGFFVRLRQVVMERPGEQFDAAIRETLVGELYEFIGKLRNAMAARRFASLPGLALEMARYGAFIIGLANRRCFSSGVRVLEEALGMPDRPAGFDGLCRLAMSGQLSDPSAVAAACEEFWAGVQAWAAQKGYAIVESRRIPF